MNDTYKRLSAIDPGERVLLISYCLRPSKTCPGRATKAGLICPDGCDLDCAVGRLRRAALDLGYKGVCIAAGGRMALRYVAETVPRGIVAVACEKELEEGVEGVEELTQAGGKRPTIAVVPLTKDGCVDTEVDEEQALETITAGCLRWAARSA